MSDERIVRPPKSTTGRSRSMLAARALRSGFVIGERLAPALSARVADAMFFTPPRTNGRGLPALPEGGRAFIVETNGIRLEATRWGDGPRVALVHGWGGSAASLAAFIPALVAAGFTPVAWDAPAHGRAAGRRTNAVQMSAAVRAVAKAVAGFAGIVAHSVGATSSALALRDGLSVRGAVFLAPAGDPEGFTRSFARRLGIGPRTEAGLRRLAELRIGRPWAEFNVPVMLAGLEAPLLVVHDEGDREIEWSEGAAIAAAAPAGRLLTTAGLGHSRLLRDAAVVEAAVSFLARAMDGRTRGLDPREVDDASTGT